MTDCHSCTTPQDCESCEKKDETLDEALIRINHEDTIRKIRHKIVVMSGKGGVGKSTIAVNLAASLAMSGHSVGLLDIDLHGPSIPTMLNLVGTRLALKDNKLIPAGYEMLKVMSIGFMLEDENAAVIWRGPAKAGIIQQFINDVDWGEIDYLVIDCPPGTGDEPLSVIQALGNCDGAVVVTTPQNVALADVRKSINFCHKMNLPVLGVIENMSGLACPHCQQIVDIFKSGGGEKMAKKMKVPFLGKIPIDPAIVTAGDDGHPYVHRYSKSATAAIMEEMALIISEKCEIDETDKLTNKETLTMRFAIPLADGQLCMHFGHCEQFALIDVNAETNEIIGQAMITPPPHEPGLLPRWLHEQGATTIIAGGMGGRAKDLFAQNEITVVVGAPVADPVSLVKAYLNQSLVTGANTCDH